MATTKKKANPDPSMRPTDDPGEILRDILIIQLCQAGVKFDEVRALARCGGARVSRISKALKGDSGVKKTKKATRRGHLMP